MAEPTGEHALDLEEVAPPIEVEPQSRPISIPELRERARSRLAMSLLIILGIEVTAAFVALFCGFFPSDIKDILTVILSPTVALVGSALGFYFGTDNQRPDR